MRKIKNLRRLNDLKEASVIKTRKNILVEKSSLKNNRVEGYTNISNFQHLKSSPIDQVLFELGLEIKVSEKKIKDVLKNYYCLIFQKYNETDNSFTFAKPKEYNASIEKILPKAKESLKQAGVKIS